MVKGISCMPGVKDKDQHLLYKTLIYVALHVSFAYRVPVFQTTVRRSIGSDNTACVSNYSDNLEFQIIQTSVKKHCGT